MTTANEIAEKIAAENDLTKAQAKTIVDSVFKAIADAAASGAETSLPGSASSRSRIAPHVRAAIRRPAQRLRSQLPGS